MPDAVCNCNTAYKIPRNQQFSVFGLFLDRLQNLQVPGIVLRYGLGPYLYKRRVGNPESGIFKMDSQGFPRNGQKIVFAIPEKVFILLPPIMTLKEELLSGESSGKVWSLKMHPRMACSWFEATR